MSEEIITVMIVEDDPLAAKIYEQFTTRLGGFLMIAAASTGRQALEFMEVYTPQLILLDVFLPDMNGIDVLRHARQREYKTDFILITAANDTETVSDAIHGGAFGYIIKPIMLDKFTTTLEQYAAMRAQLGQRQTMAQHEVDQLFRPAPAGSPVETAGGRSGQAVLPKGIDKLTLRLIREKIRSFEAPMGADEFATAAGMSHSTVRRYLEYLVSVSEVQVDILYGTVGRPERKYSWRRP